MAETKQTIRQRAKQNAQKKRQKLYSYKLAKGCADCGYNLHPWALELDHLPGTIKLRTVASQMYMSWKKIEEELAKCDVVCANCHAIRTMTRKLGEYSPH